MTVTNFAPDPPVVLTGAVIAHHGSDPIRGIDIIYDSGSNKLITYSD